MCFCYGVTVKDIEKAVANGAKSFKEVQDITKAGKGCGGCTFRVKKIVDELVKK